MSSCRFRSHRPPGTMRATLPIHLRPAVRARVPTDRTTLLIVKCPRRYWRMMGRRGAYTEIVRRAILKDPQAADRGAVRPTA
ncbi:hypothetical protein IBTHAUMO2_20007 [Nitrosopumilaceae archaeon]|nr:hypothetical protein IBTHAUMO2_20007 [Nitrosopumilaceae archaeon]